MLLQSAASQPPLHHHNYTPISPTSSLSYQYPSGFSDSTLQSLTFFPNSTHQKTTGSVFKCSSISQVNNNHNTVDYEKKPYPKWKDIFQRVNKVETDFEKNCPAALNQWEDEGNKITKWELNKILKEFRKRKRYQHALAVFEWMTSQDDRYVLSIADSSVHLDLIAKVRGTSDAEDFFYELPDIFKDERAYVALLNGYVRSKDREKAESLHAQMKEKGCNNTFSYNVMMNLYMSLKDYDKVESVVSEMTENNIALDLFTYNIWISSLGSQGCVEKMEQVVDQMNQDSTIRPNWSSITMRATMYIKLGQLEKAEQCLKLAESRLTGRNRIPYHYMISLYSQIGNKEEVKRIWNIYRTGFSFIPTIGYYIMISALTKVGDIEEAEKLYEEWLSSANKNFDARICNRLMLWYVRNGFPEKAKDWFYKIGEHGGKPLSSSWEILAVASIVEGRVSEAVSCLEKAVMASGSENWKLRPETVTDFLELCEQKGDVASKDILIGLMKKLGCFENKGYMACIPRLNAGTNKSIAEGRTDEYDDDDDDDDDELLLSQLEAHKSDDDKEKPTPTRKDYYLQENSKDGEPRSK